MAETLFFRQTRPGLQWLLFDQSGNKRDEGEADVASFNARFAGFAGSVVFVVPGEDVLLTRAKVPSRRQRQILQAVPYAVEEQLASDVEDCFFALGERNDQGEILVSVCDLEQMESRVEFLSRLAVDVMTLVSETSLVETSGAAAVIDQERVHIRWLDGTGLTVPVGQLAMTLATGHEEPPFEITGNSEAVESLAIQLSELEAGGREVHRNPVEETGFYLLCRQFNGRQTNLLQGAYKVAEKHSGFVMVWRSVAILAGVALLLHLLLLAGQGWFLSRKASEYQAASLSLYQSIFPDDRNLRDLRRRWDAHLGRSGASGAGAFISLFGQASRDLPGAGLTLQKVNFNESRGDLILQVTGERSELLVQYAQRLSSEGLSAEIGTISQEGEGVRGSIRLGIL